MMIFDDLNQLFDWMFLHSQFLNNFVVSCCCCPFLLLLYLLYVRIEVKEISFWHWWNLKESLEIFLPLTLFAFEDLMLLRRTLSPHGAIITLFNFNLDIFTEPCLQILPKEKYFSLWFNIICNKYLLTQIKNMQKVEKLVLFLLVKVMNCDFFCFCFSGTKFRFLAQKKIWRQLFLLNLCNLLQFSNISNSFSAKKEF